MCHGGKILWIEISIYKVSFYETQEFNKAYPQFVLSLSLQCFREGFCVSDLLFSCEKSWAFTLQVYKEVRAQEVMVEEGILW